MLTVTLETMLGILPRLRAAGLALAHALALAALTLLLAAPAQTAQSRGKKKLPDPRPFSEAGIVSQEVQAVGDPALRVFAESFPGKEWLYLETDHCRFASSLGELSLGKKDRKRLAPELDLLRLYFPKLPLLPKKLTAEQYLFLMGMRMEKLYRDVQKVLQVSDADFPASRAAQRGEGAYMGDGPYLGEREKFDFILHREMRTHEEFALEQRGVNVKDSARWHNRAPSKMILSMPCHDSDLSKDQWLWPHLAHNATHMMLDGYKFFAYDIPLWLTEGFALYFEKQIEPDSWTREGGEGVFFERERSKDWAGDVRKLGQKQKHAKVTKLMHAKGPADLDRDAHLTIWSMTNFLIEKYPDQYAQLLGTLKAQLDEQGYPTGRGMLDLQRKQFKEIWDWTPMQLEEKWLLWVTGKDEEVVEK
ncbi:MAG: hypothetical protein H8E15_13620 [Planctomycetes bacterium]|nr:hypothetical protein [Planctomycetota bacterium]